MVNGIRTIYPDGLNRVQFEGWKTHRPKRYEYNNKDVDNSLNILSDKNNEYFFLYGYIDPCTYYVRRCIH